MVILVSGSQAAIVWGFGVGDRDAVPAPAQRTARAGRRAQGLSWLLAERDGPAPVVAVIRGPAAAEKISIIIGNVPSATDGQAAQ